jgi:putative ABC transport system permease protein
VPNEVLSATGPLGQRPLAGGALGGHRPWSVLGVLEAARIGFVMAVAEMRAHRLRSLLSMTGIFLGVTSMLAMLTLIGGIDRFLHDKMAIWVGAVWFKTNAEVPAEQRASWLRSPGLRLSDGAYLQRHSPYVQNPLNMIAERAAVSVGAQTESVIVRGLDAATFDLDRRHIVLGHGRWLEPHDYRLGSRVCIISWELEDTLVERLRLLSPLQLVGKPLAYKGRIFTIVGSFHPRDQNFRPWHLRRTVMFPIATIQRDIKGGDPDPGRLQMQAVDPARLRTQARSIADTLRERHRGANDFTYELANFMEDVQRTLENVSLLMAIISVISLTVGGLSIMNVMLSSVSERVHEIGVRKALGAQNAQVLVQFLAESVALSLAGGSMGFLAGLFPLLLKDALMRATDGVVEPVFLASHAVAVLATVVGLGVLFGIYPALRACRLRPADALRYE